MIENGYSIRLDELCKNQSFSPSQVVSSELVYPKGAVPNSQLLWIRVVLTNEEVKFVTLSLSEFHTYVELPTSRLGGLADGDYGSELDKHLKQYGLEQNARHVADADVPIVAGDEESLPKPEGQREVQG